MPEEKPLSEYNRKRDFDVTAEPAGEPVESSASKLRFVIQKHAATRLHYDFRLEWAGVMWSWAVPRGPSLDPKERRLAVRTEDHPVSYRTFEGTIPKGEYGGGHVIVWDHGTWEPIGDPAEGLRKGKVAFKLHGERCKGEWRLVKSGKDGKEEDTWFLLKKTDDVAERGVDLARRFDTSVTTGRTIDDIREGRSEPSGADVEPLHVEDGVKGPLPSDMLPELPTVVDRAPDGWLHEVKHDGYRALVSIDGGVARITTRRGHDWTDRFLPVARAAEEIRVRSALIDGEVVVRGKDGLTSFPALQQVLAAYPGRVPGLGNMEFIAFDLLYIDGRDLTDVQLVRRKELLRDVLDRSPPGSPIRYSAHLDGKFAPVLENARQIGLEGLVSKDPTAPYRPGRSRRWLKIKCRLTDTFEVIGYYPSDLGGIASLHVAHRDDHTEAGGVGTGFDDTMRHMLLSLLEPMADGRPRRDGFQNVHPGVLIEVEFTGMTQGRNLRHASFIGIRDDLMDKEIPATKASAAIQPTPEAREAVARLRITHPEKELWPDAGVTKAETIAYYATIAERILPGLIGRPLSLVRCPDGVQGQKFFQKHWHHALPPGVGVVDVQGDDEPNIVIESLDGLLQLVQWNVVEFHPWGVRSRDQDHPDRLIWDLDPDEELPWEGVASTAHRIRERLDSIGLKSFVRTTGGKGLHVVIPIEPTMDWDTARAFTVAVGESVQRETPGLVVMNMSKKKRAGRLFMDVLRNGRGATAVASWSTRARPGAKIAVPIAWSEVATVGTTGWDVRSIWSRLATQRVDPWADFATVRQEVPGDVIHLLRKL